MRRHASEFRVVASRRVAALRRRVRALTLFSLAALVAVTTAGSSAAQTNSPGGTLVLLTQAGQFDHLDPARIYYGRDVAFTSSFLFRTLTSYQHVSGAQGTALAGDLATDTGSTSDGGKTWQFTLRDGSAFEDGSAITCADVKYGVSRAFATTVITDGPQYAVSMLDIPRDIDGTSSYKGPYTGVGQDLFDAAVTCSPDDRTITFHLAKPRMDFNETLAYVAYSPVRASADTAGNYDLQPMSSGPYKITSYVPGNSLVLDRNPNWNPASDLVRQANPDRIIVRFGIDMNARDQVFMYDAYPNAVNFDGGMLPTNIQTFFADPSTASRRLNTFDPYVRFAAVNVKAVPCLEVRQAVFFAMPMQSILNLYGGPEFYGVPGDSPVKPTVGLDYAPTTGNIHDGEWFIGGNAAKVAALLAAATAKGGSCADVVSRATDPSRGLVWDMPNSSMNQKVAAIITTAMSDAGITMKFNFIPPSGYYSTVLNPAMQHDISNEGWGADWSNASTVLPELFLSGGRLNLAQNAADPAYGAFASLIDQALAAPDRTTQAAFWKQASQYVMDQYWMVRPIFSKTQYVWGSAVGAVHAWDAWGTLDFGSMTVDASITGGTLTPALKYSVVDGANPATGVSGSVRWCRYSNGTASSCTAMSTDALGNGAAWLSTGDYRARATTGSGATLRQADFAVHVTANGVVVDGASTKVGGAWVLPVGNLSLSAGAPGGKTMPWKAQLCLVSGDGGCADWKEITSASDTTLPVSVSLAQGSWSLTAIPTQSDSVYDRKAYTVTVDGGGVVTVTDNGQALAPADGITFLPFTVGNVRLHLATETLSDLPMASGQFVSTMLQRWNGATSSWDWLEAWRDVTTVEFSKAIAEGTYRVVAAPKGYSDLGWGYSASITVDAQGTVTMASTGSPVLGAITITLTTPNLRLHVSNPATGAPLQAGFVWVMESSTSTFVASVDVLPSLNGDVGLTLPDGDFRLHVLAQPASHGEIERTYSVHVAGGLVTFDPPLQADAQTGRTIVTTGVANLRYGFTSPLSGASIDGHLEYCQLAQDQSVSNCMDRSVGVNEVTGIQLDPGTWRLRVYPNGSDFLLKDYVAVVSPDTITVTDSGTAVQPQGDGSYRLSASPPNVVAALLDPAGQPLALTGDAFVELNILQWMSAPSWPGGGFWYMGGGMTSGSTSLLGIATLDGHYKLMARPRNSAVDTLAFGLSDEFWVVNGVAMSAATGGAPLGAIPLRMPAATQWFNVADPISPPAGEMHGEVEIVKQDGVYQIWQTKQWFDTASGARVPTSLAEGVYLFTIRTLDNDAYAPVTYRVTVGPDQKIVSILRDADGTSMTVPPDGFHSTLPAGVTNLRFSIVDPSTQPASVLDGYLRFCSTVKPTNGASGCGTVVVRNALFGTAFIPAGEWSLSACPINKPQLSCRTYKASVSGVGALGIDGLFFSNTYALAVESANVFGTITDLNGGSIAVGTGRFDVQVQVLDSNGNWNWANIGTGTNTGSFGLTIQTDGRYRVLVMPRGVPAVGSAFIEVCIQNKVLMSSNCSATMSSLAVQLPPANVKLRIADPTTNSTFPNGGVGVYSMSPWASVADASGAAGSAGVLGVALTPGKYRVFADPRNGDSKFVSGVYDITVADDLSVSVFLENSATAITADQDGVFTLMAKVVNAQFITVDPASPDVAVIGAVNWCKQALTGESCSGLWTGDSMSNPSRTAIADGTYVIRVTPRNGNVLLGQAEYAARVDSGTVTIDGVSKDANGVWRLPFAAANLTGTITLNGADFVGGDTRTLHLEVQREINGGWNWFNNGADVRGSGYGFRVSAAGHYRIIANSNNIPDLGWTYSGEFWVNASGELSLTQAGPYTATLSGLAIAVRDGNLKLLLVDPRTNTPLSSGWVGIVRIESNSSTWVMNADSYNFNGRTGAWLADGRYQLDVNPAPWDASNLGLSRAFYTVVKSGDSITVTDAGGKTVLPNDQGRYPLAVTKSSLLVRLQTPDHADAGGNVEYCLRDTSGNLSNCSGQGFGAGQTLGLPLTQGEWRLRVSPWDGQYDTSEYSATIASDGTVTIKLAGLEVAASSGVYVLVFAAGNVSVSLLDQAGTAMSFGNAQNAFVEVQRLDDYGNWQNFEKWRWSNQPTVKFKLGVGSYRVTGRPSGFSDLGTGFSGTFFVCTDGGPAYATSGCSDAALPSVELRFPASNFKMQLVDPRDNSSLRYGWVSFFKLNGRNEAPWVGNADLDGSGTGFASMALTDGQYNLDVNASGAAATGLTHKDYRLTVSNGGATFHLCPGTQFTCTAEITVDAGSGRFILTPGKANISGRAVLADGTPFTNGYNVWLNVALQKLNEGNGNWDWIGWYGIDGSGFFSVTATETGTYRLMLEPQGRSDASTTYSASFDIKDPSTTVDLGSVTLRSPALAVKVVEPGSSTGIQWAGVELRQNDQWVAGFGTGVLGTATLNFDRAGTYDLVINPQQAQVDKGLTRRSYEVVVTQQADGTFAALVTGHPATNGVVTLELGTASLKGRVTSPDGSVGVADAQVVAVDVATQQEMWQYSVNTSRSNSNLGGWAMSLPKGTYRIYARAPWGTALYGSSQRLGTISIDANGNATLTGDLGGKSATSLDLNLASPTWSGVVQDPSGNPVANAWVCLYNGTEWSCASSNASGEWALSGSATLFEGAVLEVSDPQNLYPRLRKNGALEVASILKAGGGNILKFVDANVHITVLAGGTPARYLWVNLEQRNVMWLASNSTNAQGVATMYVDSSKLSADLRVRVDVYGDYAADFATTTLDTTCVMVGGICNITVNLNQPNVLGVVRTPDGAASSGSWVEVLRDSSRGREWVGGASTDANGYFSLYAPAVPGQTQAYTLRVNPSWLDADSAAREYIVTVDADGKVVSFQQTAENGSAAVGTELLDRSRYALRLGTPSVTGKVTTPAGVGVRDSWVVAINVDSGQWLWERGNNSRLNGDFGLNLPDGTYRVEAQQSWTMPDLTKSAQCLITVSAGHVSSGDSACIANGVLQLKLRGANLHFTLRDSNDVPVANANVGIGYGAWWTNAQSRSDGSVSLFIDGEAILSLNSQWLETGTVVNPNVWVDPPWNSSGLVRWDCTAGAAKPICSQLETVTAGNAYAGATELGNIAMLSSNTTITVTDSSGNAVGAGAWVTLWEVNAFGQWNWLGGGNTNSSGRASFYVPNASDGNVRYVVEVNPPWDNHAAYVWKRYGESQPLTYAQVDGQSFALGSPNLTVTVLSSDGLTNRWGWVGIDIWNGQAWSQYTGYGLDNAGSAALVLPANQRFRVVSTAGSGIAGSRTICEIQTDETAVVSTTPSACSTGTLSGTTLTMRLQAGNVVGKVVDANGAALAGVIVVAEDADHNMVSTASNDKGAFALNLDESKLWKLSFLPPNSSGLQVKVIDAFNPATDAATVSLVGLVK